MKTRYFALLTLLACVFGCGRGPEVGQTLPEWKEGEMDIHFINTARGESTYQILPDGTTVLVDASGSLLKFGGAGHSQPLTPRPSSSLSPGTVIVDYINHFSPKVSKGHVNYFLLTHFHPDHMGHYNNDLPMGPDSLFRLASLEEIGTKLVFDKIMDRCYPEYSYPTHTALKSPMMDNYRSFLEWTKQANNSQVEKFEAGSCQQIVPLHDKSLDVEVRNYSGNGRFWDGKGNSSCTIMPSAEEFEAGDPAAIPGENCFSCSYILSYGDFDIFLGGDLQINGRKTYPYMDAESPVAKVAHKVEVMKADHHGTKNTNCPELMSVLQPDVWVVSNWRDVQPNPKTVDNVLAANPACDIFCTNMPEKNIPVLGEDRMKKIVGYDGHVVVRVSKGGKSYSVYLLDDTNEEYKVKAIYGPYQSRGE